MTKYQELLNNPPVFTKLYDSENLREVIFETISCMCDNKHFLKFRKNSDGDFKMNGNGHSLRNWSMNYQPHDIEWEADDNNWGSVINMINTGTSRVSTVKFR